MVHNAMTMGISQDYAYLLDRSHSQKLITIKATLVQRSSFVVEAFVGVLIQHPDDTTDIKKIRHDKIKA